MERVSRKICVEMGSIASTCKAPRTGREVKDWGIHFTTTKAIRIGRPVREANRLHTDPIAALLESEGGKRLFTGKVVDVARRTTEGFLRGSVAIEGIDDDRGSRLELVVPERVDRRLARRRGRRDVARPDLRARQRLGRRGRHRDGPLRPAGHRGRAARARRPDQPARPRHSSAPAPLATTWISVPFSKSALALECKLMRRIGIDVGGTNTDAVLLDGDKVVLAVKTPTTQDVTSGILDALKALRADPARAAGRSTR